METMEFKPMLAKDPKDIDALSYPLLVQPKLDGIRASIVGGKLVSRSLKPIPNLEIRAALEGRRAYEGFDGELVVGDGTDFQASTSFVMSPNKTGANWTYHVFDLWNKPKADNLGRCSILALVAAGLSPGGRVQVVPTGSVKNADELAKYEAACLEVGLEGVIARIPSAFYKFGRSSPIKGPLFKIKRFIDFEAEVVGVYEKMHNDNPAMTNALGRSERSSAKAGKRGAGVLGGLELVALNGPAKGVEFRCGTGFNDVQRESWWNLAHDRRSRGANTDVVAGNGLNGLVAKIKSFPIGVKDAPRFPVFLGFRNMEIDG